MQLEKIVVTRRQRSNSWRKYRRSAGFWLGENKNQVTVETVLTGTAPFVVQSIPGFENDPPSVSEPAFAMCLRAAAWHVSSLSAYLPIERAMDFLPFVQVQACCLEYRRPIVEKMFRVGEPGGRSSARPIKLRTLNEWTLRAKTIFALFPGVTETSIRELIEAAGTHIGLGMFSPKHKIERENREGAYGSFALAKFETLSGAWLDSPNSSKGARAAAKNVSRTVSQIALASDEDDVDCRRDEDGDEEDSEEFKP